MNVLQINLENLNKNLYHSSKNVYPYVFFTGEQANGTDTFNRMAEDISPADIIDETLLPVQKPERIPLSDAQKVSGVHCPVCGNKMLSQEAYNKLVEDALQITTSKKLLNLLEKNEDFIPNKYKRVLQDSKRIPKRYDLSVKEYISALTEISHDNKIKAIKHVKDYLVNYSETLPEESSLPLIEFASSINENTPYETFKTNLTEILGNLNLNIDKIHEIRKNTLKEYKLGALYENLLTQANIEDYSDGETAQKFIANMFASSRSKLSEIERYSERADAPYNCIMLCHDCHNHQSKKAFFRDNQLPDLKNNVILYLKDISFLNGSNVIDIPNSYIIYVCNRVSALSKRKINFSQYDINSVNAAQKVLSRHDDFEPILQTEVDIPCAECGTTMLPHAIKLKIIEKMKECKTPYDYAELLQKYDKYIGFYSRDFAGIFTGIVENKPYISEQEFLETFAERAKNCLESRICSSLSNYQLSKTYYKRVDYKSMDIYQKVFKNVKKYIADGKFEDFNYGKLKAECFDTINFADVNIRAVSLLQRDLKTISYKHMLAFPNSEKISDNPDKIYDIVYGLFNADTATVDHLTAIRQGGKKNSKYNMIGLCKGCNRLKGSKTVIAWYDQHPFMRINFPKQLSVIDDMAKNNELEDYDDWAAEMADQMCLLTKGEFDITDQFPKKD